MTKQKFELTSDLVKVEDEPVVVAMPLKKEKPIREVKIRERLSADIDSELKQKLQLLAFKKRTNMTDIIERALIAYAEREGD